jgi:hypothetical protein
MADKLRRPQRIRAIEANLAAMAERRATAPRAGTATGRPERRAAAADLAAAEVSAPAADDLVHRVVRID